ncbi:MAG: PEP-utilizing enzyme, partial [Bacteroidota bacterium]
FSAMGRQFQSLGVLSSARDIFYLTKEEVFNFITGTAVMTDLKALVRLRKAEYAHYQDLPQPSERIQTYGPVYVQNDFYPKRPVSLDSEDLKGVGCCPGVVRAKVQIIHDPREVHTLNGDILVTSSTDPGWVTLFPTASGILVERGSLLSHSAIVSREMGIPCIVAVDGLLAHLKSGDEVEMDGSTGHIKKLSA